MAKTVKKLFSELKTGDAVMLTFFGQTTPTLILGKSGPIGAHYFKFYLDCLTSSGQVTRYFTVEWQSFECLNV